MRADTRGYGRIGILLGPALGIALVAAACSSSAAPGIPSSGSCEGPRSIPLDGACLVFEDGERLESFRPAIEGEIRAALSASRPLIPIDGVTVRILAGRATVIPEIGFGGRAFGGEVVQLTFDPESPRLPSSLETELLPLVAHELHHVARQRTVGYGSDLLGAMVSEGLADHFAIEVSGAPPPPWSVALTEDELARWSESAETHWFDTTYDHGIWFFGTSATVPRWAGYSIGFRMVGTYLTGDPDRSASGLHDAPRRAFIPDGMVGPGMRTGEPGTPGA